MRIVYKDLKRGIIKIQCEILDDLWYLSQIISSNDLVKSKTQRRIKDSDDQRSTGGERKTISLVLRVERIEFKAETQVLKIHGIIEDGPDDIVSVGSYHSFNIDSKSTLSVSRENWGKLDLERIQTACDSTLRPRVLIVSMDLGEASVAIVRESKTDYIDLNKNIGGKFDQSGRDKRKTEFFSELTQLLSGLCEKEHVGNLIIAGPGFEKNNFHKYLIEHNPVIAKIAVVEDIGSSGRNGVQEVLKRDVIHRNLEQVNSVRDIRYVEDLLAEISKDSGLSAYGLEDVEKAVNANAVDLLLVSDEMLFTKRQLVEPLMNSVKNSRGTVHLINHEQEAGKKLSSIGGVAVKLRYRLN